ncbi:MAG: ATP synthase F1 subunit delta [Candidatus Buchananbacteria bacterium RIFCSPHIGHO2_02_FULL_45_11b]|uniref:ATP synthase subunit delta n=3 Tax=Candidatus Buchananiibacteriota TaxID=1817903 RepID=A0A1G1Y9X0_9BACT|nr:MAG: ATP synthase F1 subunit delta [Candidatus Buchananbacteria bacterium RIFCSPHIGHO2_01_FULL_46_12]OGY50792.1 MAG: ATP synthase F1 subunit delta [Candidatus Buchananbacteria bacterium RIFCSPHIGHO2_02_FULL_45_11b]OGY55840.1 MAG: ATP synthase F1 subunit delta [Candidatus Buchananbacteria bacterium RIFCSPLOWO2_02_FULL_46_11b]
MKVNTKAYAIALYETIKDAKGEQSKTAIANFVALLAKKNLLPSANKIMADFTRHYNQAEGIAAITAETAKALSSEEKDELIKNLKKITGKEIELETAVKPELIGGLKLKIGDALIDGSWQNQLSTLRKKLIS